MTSPERARVLAVDDERPTLDTMRRAFRKDFDITTAVSGVEAIACLEREAFDVVLTDFAMPVMNGIELLRRAAIVQPNAVRILVTAHGALDEINAARAAGVMAAIIMKPWTKEAILRWVTHAHQVARMRMGMADLNVGKKA